MADLLQTIANLDTQLTHSAHELMAVKERLFRVEEFIAMALLMQADHGCAPMAQGCDGTGGLGRRGSITKNG